MTTEQEILNAASDDWESLDQIFLSVRFEFASEHYDSAKPHIHYWQDRNPSVTLAEIVETILRLVEARQLDVRREDRSSTTTIRPDDVIRSWFKVTDAGRLMLEEVKLE
jgi:hypothetical protein